ncbi:MerR family DNA-binding protein, partial [Enterococcus faecium]
QRVSGIRKFSENELEALRVIDCLKKSGLEIKDIKQFMEWSKEGSKTFEVRKELFEKQKEVVEKEIAKLERVLAMLNYKSWYYEEAIKAGNEEAVLTMIPDDLPQHVKEAYVHSH